MSLLSDLLSVFLPRTCAACGLPLKDWEECICLTCMAGLPLTRFHQDPSNPLAEVFWGRVRIEQAVAWFYFRKGSAYQEVLHNLKYNNRPDIGIFLGKQLGYELKHSTVFIRPDIVVPVPLHRKKPSKRGYNQSEKIARGISVALDVRLDTKNLYRSAKTDTQTRKSRFDRYLNVSGKFAIRDPATIENSHILLVDDVVTTGATLEACAEALLSVPGVKVSIATVAWAKE
jgi:ComF family protein